MLWASDFGFRHRAAIRNLDLQCLLFVSAEELAPALHGLTGWARKTNQNPSVLCWCETLCEAWVSLVQFTFDHLQLTSAVLFSPVRIAPGNETFLSDLHEDRNTCAIQRIKRALKSDHMASRCHLVNILFSVHACYRTLWCSQTASCAACLSGMTGIAHPVECEKRYSHHTR